MVNALRRSYSLCRRTHADTRDRGAMVVVVVVIVVVVVGVGASPRRTLVAARRFVKRTLCIIYVPGWEAAVTA